MLRSIGGAALMGAGGAMAYGCSIGQGLTGLSTLALASFVAVAGICWAPLRDCAVRSACSRWQRARSSAVTNSIARQSAADVTIWISEVRVRCTGHLSAISINFLRCSASSAPSMAMTRSIWSSIPALVSHSAQSSA